MTDAQGLKEFLGLSKFLETKPDDVVITAALIIKEALSPFSDNGLIDAGMGFGEACLDFRTDGKAIRVIVKQVPDNSVQPTGGACNASGSQAG